MVRSSKKARRLVVGEETFLWSLGHRHRREHDRYFDCRELLGIRRYGAYGRLTIVFADGPGRLVPDGIRQTGAIGTTGGDEINLHEPGIVRALLDVARFHGWRPEERGDLEMDGWALFDEVISRRNAAPPV